MFRKTFSFDATFWKSIKAMKKKKKLSADNHHASFSLADLGISREWTPPFTSTRYLPEDVSSITSSLYLKGSRARVEHDDGIHLASKSARSWRELTNHLTMGKGKPSTVQKSLTEVFSYTVWDLSLARKCGPLTMGPSYTYFSVAFFFTCRREEGTAKLQIVKTIQSHLFTI